MANYPYHLSEDDYQRLDHVKGTISFLKYLILDSDTDKRFEVDPDDLAHFLSIIDGELQNVLTAANENTPQKPQAVK